MDRCYFVLPITGYGTLDLDSVEAFLDEENLNGCVFTSKTEAEKRLLEVHTKYDKHQFDYISKFGLFTLAAHAERTGLGHKVVPTV